MSVSKFLGSFVQSAFFGGTYDDAAFEIRVLKSELQRLHQRLDNEFAELNDRIDRLEGKPGKGKGRSRLNVIGGAELADVAPSASDPEVQAAPPSALAPSVRDATAPAGGFVGSMSIREAHEQHPRAQDVFTRHHLPSCTHCALSATETVEQGARDHGLDVEALLADLNHLAEA